MSVLPYREEICLLHDALLLWTDYFIHLVFDSESTVI